MKLWKVLKRQMNSKDYNLKHKKDNIFIAEVFISKDSTFFDGHFENFKLFPAIAQIKIAVDMAKEIFNIDFKVNKLSKVKFTNMIYPNTKVDIEGHYLNDSLTFKIYDNDKKYSEGRANITLL